MRIAFSVLLAAAAGVSLWLDSPERCVDGLQSLGQLCRQDQFGETGEIALKLYKRDGYVESVKAEPVHLFRLADYADGLSSSGRDEAAGRVWRHISTYSSGSAPILMRLGNYYLIRDKYAEYLPYARRVLGMTSSYNTVIFSSLSSLEESGRSLGMVYELALPQRRETANSLLAYLEETGADARQLNTLWQWMLAHELASQNEAGRVAAALVKGGDFRSARQVWMTLTPKGEKEVLLGNGRFFREPVRSPFDWQIREQRGVQFQRRAGLAVRFDGTVNLSLANVRQCAWLQPGPYRLLADVSSEGLTTDQRPFFQVFDAQSPSRLMVETPMVEPSAAHASLEAKFHVTSASQWVCVQLARRPSGKFDNKIEGSLRIHSVKLEDLNARTRTSASAK